MTSIAGTGAARGTKRSAPLVEKARDLPVNKKGKKRAKFCDQLTDDAFDDWAHEQCVKASAALEAEDYEAVARLVRILTPALRPRKNTSVFYSVIRHRIRSAIGDMLIFLECTEHTAHLLGPVLDCLDAFGVPAGGVDSGLDGDWRKRPKRGSGKKCAVKVEDEECGRVSHQEPDDQGKEPTPHQLQQRVVRRKRNYQKCAIAGCTGLGLLSVDADDVGPQGLRCKNHGGRFPCAVKGCPLNGIRSAMSQSGTLERFCNRHGQQCCMPDCTRAGVRKIYDAEPVGWRCRIHGGAKECEVEGCSNRSELSVATRDEYGPPGRRCGKHGRRCTVRDCSKMGHRHVSHNDKYGCAGFRCLKHGGGHLCSIEGCTNVALNKKHPFGDRLGPAGWRCDKHIRPCVADGCNARGRKMTAMADQYGPAGYRCYKHRAVEPGKNEPPPTA